MAGCDTCRLSREAMQEAGASYRAWVPVAAAPFLMQETMAKAAELTGSDWSETIAERVAARAPRRARAAPRAGRASRARCAATAAATRSWPPCSRSWCWSWPSRQPWSDGEPPDRQPIPPPASRRVAGEPTGKDKSKKKKTNEEAKQGRRSRRAWPGGRPGRRLSRDR